MEQLKPKGKVGQKKRGKGVQKSLNVAVRQRANSIRVLQDSQGSNLDTFESISGELVRFFSGSLGVVDDNVEPVSDDLLKELLGVELTAEMQNSLIAPVTNKEIKDVIFTMNGNKAPGPDRYSAKFFQVAWSIVGNDVLSAVHHFFCV
ncbi:hypothetical protein V6N11_031889 [Hibiscus sabdariffa]|uniref:Reverse transcriptase n=1 Tax=Hibiscus sabdariffa TaxID=183260 RepID=A0ABR2SZ12_9ROSI